MTLDLVLSRDGLTLGPFSVPVHLHPFLKLVLAQPWAVDDSWWPRPAQFYKRKLTDPASVVMAGYKRGRFFGAIDLSGIVPGREAWISGYGRSGEPFAALGFLEMALGWAFEILKLQRIGAHYCSLNRGVEMVMKAVDFQEEGLIRRSRWYQGRPYDTKVAGLLREEFGHGR